MSRRRLLGTGAAALALTLVLPTAALACEKGGDGGGGSGGSGSSAEHGKSEHAKGGDKSKDQKGDSQKGDSQKGDSQKGKDEKAKDEKAKDQSGSTSESGHNPPGNNGTIKIDYAAPADSGHANRPHPGCAFQLRMFNFDENQYGTITFVGQAPTKLGTLLTQTHVLLSDDAAGGGQDVDAVYSYTAQQLGLIGKPQAKQGWHIKVSVDADNAPGGAKHKVFWLKCDQAPAATSNSGGTTSNGGTTTPVTTTPGTTTPATTTTSTSAGTTTTTTQTTGTSAGAATAAAAPAAAAPAAAPATTVTGGEAAAAAAPAAAPAAQPASSGSALPFTGSNIVTMLLIALAALLAGGFAIRAGRRRTSQL